MGWQSYLVFGWGLQFVSALILVGIFHRNLTFPSNTKVTGQIVLLGVIYALGGGLFIASLVGSDSASIISAASGLKVVFTMLLAYVLLKERNKLGVRLAATITATVGGGLLLY
jgi:drug/metabolite transporter (DMT)-like permease